MIDIEAILNRWSSFVPEGLVEELEAAFAAARGRWIPVGEGLPEDTRDVLCMDKNHFVDGTPERFVGWYSAPEPAWIRGAACDSARVTHWRELPEPPKEGGSNG